MKREEITVFINPFLISVIKELWIIYKVNRLKMVPTQKITEDDYELITNSSENGSASNLKRRFFAADKKPSFAKVVTLDKLCLTIKSHIPTFPEKWLDLENRFSKNPTFSRLQLSEKYRGNKKPFHNEHIKLLLTSVDIIKEESNRLYNEAFPKSNINAGYEDLLSSSYFQYPPTVAIEEDIQRIYEFAQGRYDCSINGPEIKTPWWIDIPGQSGPLIPG